MGSATISSDNPSANLGRCGCCITCCGNNNCCFSDSSELTVNSWTQTTIFYNDANCQNESSRSTTTYTPLTTPEYCAFAGCGFFTFRVQIDRTGESTLYGIAYINAGSWGYLIVNTTANESDLDNVPGCEFQDLNYYTGLDPLNDAGDPYDTYATDECCKFVNNFSGCVTPFNQGMIIDYDFEITNNKCCYVAPGDQGGDGCLVGTGNCDGTCADTILDPLP